jgi:hypothetical protein
MPDEITPPAAPVEDAFQRYVDELEPLVAEKAPQVRLPDNDHAFLGVLSDLAPSRPRSVEQLGEADQTWLRALEFVAHRHGVSYELISHVDGDDHLLLVPLH